MCVFVYFQNNVPNLIIQKNASLNLMSYIKQFWRKHSLEYYHAMLSASCDKCEFTDWNTFPNLFSLTMQMFVMGDGMEQKDGRCMGELVQNNIRIRYEQLQNVSLRPTDMDNDILLLIKTKFKYVSVQMHQVLIRLILIYHQTTHTQQITPQVERNIREIGYIYPALKAEISINESNINLNHFFDKYLGFFFNRKTIRPLFRTVLVKIKEECHIMFGMMENIFEKYIYSQAQKDVQKKTTKLDSQNKKENSIKSKSVEARNEPFDEKSMFRKNKKILKERFKPQLQNMARTPAKNSFDEEGYKIQKSEGLNTQEQSESGYSSHSSALQKRILLKSLKKPLQRTLYHATKYISKPKNASCHDESIDQIYHLPSLTNTESSNLLYEMNKRMFQKSSANAFQQEQDDFYVPATPNKDDMKRKIEKMGKTSESEPRGISTKLRLTR